MPHKPASTPPCSQEEDINEEIAIPINATSPECNVTHHKLVTLHANIDNFRSNQDVVALVVDNMASATNGLVRALALEMKAPPP